MCLTGVIIWLLNLSFALKVLLLSMQMKPPSRWSSLPFVSQCSRLQKPLYNYFFIASPGTIKVTKSMNVCKAQAGSASCSVSSNCSHREDILSCRSKLMENPPQSRPALEKCLLRAQEKIGICQLIAQMGTLEIIFIIARNI